MFGEQMKESCSQVLVAPLESLGKKGGFSKAPPKEETGIGTAPAGLLEPGKHPICVCSGMGSG